MNSDLQEDFLVPSPIAPEPQKELKEREVAYVVDDRYFKGFEVVKSANAFWMDKGKVEDLIRCFKQGYNIKQACIFTGISKDQYYYFTEVHPNFSYVKEACEEVGKMMAETNIHHFLQNKDKDITKWYAERRISEKYGKSPETYNVAIDNFNALINSPAPNVPQSILDYLEKEKNQSCI